MKFSAAIAVTLALALPCLPQSPEAAGGASSKGGRLGDTPEGAIRFALSDVVTKARLAEEARKLGKDPTLLRTFWQRKLDLQAAEAEGLLAIAEAHEEQHAKLRKAWEVHRRKVLLDEEKARLAKARNAAEMAELRKAMEAPRSEPNSQRDKQQRVDRLRELLAEEVPPLPPEEYCTFHTRLQETTREAQRQIETQLGPVIVQRILEMAKHRPGDQARIAPPLEASAVPAEYRYRILFESLGRDLDAIERDEALGLKHSTWKRVWDQRMEAMGLNASQRAMVGQFARELRAIKRELKTREEALESKYHISLHRYIPPTDQLKAEIKKATREHQSQETALIGNYIIN